MASKDDDGDNNISEKKRSRIKALEHKLSSIVSSKLPTSLSSHQSSQTKNQEKKKKIISTKAMTHFTSTPTTNKLLLASTIVSRSSELEDSEANDPAYFQLCESVHENLLGSYLQHSGGQAGGGTINGILHDLLKSGDKADKYTKGASSIKEQDKFLLLDSRTLPGGASTRARIRALRSRGKRSKKHMSMRQHRQYGSFDFPRKYQNYNLYAPMLEMWKEYIRQILRDCRQKNIEPCLLTADFHGAIFVVLESKIKSFTGVQGIMIRETVNTFGILTSENRFRGYLCRQSSTTACMHTLRHMVFECHFLRWCSIVQVFVSVHFAVSASMVVYKASLFVCYGLIFVAQCSLACLVCYVLRGNDMQPCSSFAIRF